MQILGNILIGLASFIYLLPLQLLLNAARRARNDGGAIWGAIFVFLPLWLLLTAALSVATARGGLDWLPVRRGGQHALVLLAGLALLATSIFGFLGRVEHATQLPVVSRPFLSWADLVLPLVAIAFLLSTLNPSLGTSLPVSGIRIPFAVIAAASLLHGTALLGEWFIRAQQAQVARANERQDYYARIERENLEKLKTLDPEKDVAELLDNSAHSNAEMRVVANEKLKAHPHLREAIVSVLRSWRAETALTYLASHDLTAEDRAALAEPVLDAFARVARDFENEVHGGNFFADQFDRRTTHILAVAEAFADQRLDYVGALRTLRVALDAGDAAKKHINARATLDGWLARHPAAGPKP